MNKNKKELEQEIKTKKQKISNLSIIFTGIFGFTFFTISMIFPLLQAMNKFNWNSLIFALVFCWIATSLLLLATIAFLLHLLYKDFTLHDYIENEKKAIRFGVFDAKTSYKNRRNIFEFKKEVLKSTKEQDREHKKLQLELKELDFDEEEMLAKKEKLELVERLEREIEEEQNEKKNNLN